jgi:hypothetical protein
MLHLCNSMERCGRGNIRDGLGTTSFRANVTELTKVNLRTRHAKNPSQINANSARYYVSTGTRETIGDSARRRTCSGVYSSHRDIPPGFFISQGYTMKNEEAKLGHKGVRLRDAFYAFSKLEFEREERTKVPEPEGLTETLHWTWRSKRSHVLLISFWRLYERGGNGSRE